MKLWHVITAWILGIGAIVGYFAGPDSGPLWVLAVWTYRAMVAVSLVLLPFSIFGVAAKTGKTASGNEYRLAAGALAGRSLGNAYDKLV